ncbi:MAG: hypothetical protein U5L09_15080 [Bacteroidales bacterium]|nr:hypothetical protein [Bacteroidales bacterium]
MPGGQVIDGWQQITGTVEIPDKAKEVIVKTQATDAGIAYFDDFRIHPFESQVKTYVYNPYSLKLKAQLDQNDFAGFSEYNKEGEFVGMKKETAAGVITTKVTRKGSYKSGK